MDAAGFLRQLEHDAALLATVLVTADLDAPVPGLDWTLGEVVVHLGNVHRWSADLVRERRATNATGGSAAFAPGTGVDVRRWSSEGAQVVVAELRATPDDVEVFGFGRQVPAARFWSRRQAHETAIHRADVEAAAGMPVTPFEPAFARDGLAEITGFARGFRVAPSAGRLAWVATDGDAWDLTFTDGRVTARRGADPADADATVTGTSSDLYLWAWNRPSGAVTAGDPTVAARWREVRIA